MNTHYIRIFIGLIILMSASLLHATKPVACVGVSKKCNKDVRTDKTIEGQVYSCYECKQTVCKSGGSGPIAGTETSSVFESKGPTSRSLFGDQQATQFDEADALFGKRSEVKGAHPKPQTTMKKTTRTQSVDNRKPKTVMKKPHKGTKTSKNEQIIAPNNRSTLNNRKNKTWVQKDQS